ncbi:MAG: metallophosphoesterase [Bacillota bacterium]
MNFLYIFLAVSITALIYMRYEATRLKVSRVYFTENEEHLKVIQLSDIHIKYLRVDIKKISSVLKAEKPDLVVLTGDYINNPGHIPKFLDFLDNIKGGFKVCLCFGNHDYKALGNNERALMEFRRLIEDKGVMVPLNSSFCIEKYHRKYNIIGIEDLRSKRYNVEKALESCCSTAEANIALSHNPDIAFEIPQGKIDYLLCGHFHGGQIWMPFNLEFKLLRGEKLCKMGITKGVHRVNNLTLNINSGIGNVCFPLRFFSPPEISVLYFP